MGNYHALAFSANNGRLDNLGRVDLPVDPVDGTSSLGLG